VNVESLNWQDVEECFALLPLREQMLLLERLHRKMRESAYPDYPAESDRLLDEMANDEAMRQEARPAERAVEGRQEQTTDLASELGCGAPYPIPEGVYSEDQLIPRGKR
jgi:hypothetical protein